MSERRDFITAPGEWTRVARQTADRIAYSASIERMEKPRSSWTTAEKVFAWGFVAYLLWTAFDTFCAGFKCVL